jgi:predicted enzyme related to lactoylglutathione lyase
MAIARSPITVVDCPDPGVLATFYGDLLDWDVDVDEDGSWAEAYGEDGALSFQRVEGFTAPEWPGQQHPQQMHIDVEVDDIDAAEPEVLAIGATLHDEQPSVDGGFRVFLDPAGHPFCLCRADED